MTLQPLLDGLDAYLADVERRAEAALKVQAQRAETLLKTTTAHGDVTTATRDSYTASVIGGSASAQSAQRSALDEAVATVERLNPGASETATDSIGVGNIGVTLYAPTDYQRKLETENAGQKATLGPTIRLVAKDMTEAVAKQS